MVVCRLGNVEVLANAGFTDIDSILIFFEMIFYWIILYSKTFPYPTMKDLFGLFILNSPIIHSLKR